MRRLVNDHKRSVSKRGLAAAAVCSLGIVAVATMPQLLGSQVEAAFEGLGAARPIWLWLAASSFVLMIVASASAWRTALGLCGGEIDRSDAAARYGIGGLVNSLAPGRVGDAVRVALFSRCVHSPDRLWIAGGVFATLGAARAFVLTVLLVVAVVLGAMPLWPVFALGGTVAVALAVSIATRKRRAHSRVAHLLDAFRGIGRCPARGLRLLAWLTVSTGARLGAATAIAAALGVHQPFLAALIISPALDLAGLMPLTPGNVGVTSGAVAVALQSRGVDLTTALTTGIALHAVETAASLVFGLAGALFLVRFPTPTARRWTIVATAATVCLALAAGFSATVLLPLV